MTTRRALVLFFAWAVFACQQPMDPASSVSKFRVLAVQADPPEVSPGDSVVHRVLYADPEGNGRDIYFAWITLAGLITPSSNSSEAPEVLYFQFGSLKDGADVYTIPEVPKDYLKNGAQDTDSKNDTGAAADAGPAEDASVPGDTDSSVDTTDELDSRQATTILSLCAGGAPPDWTALAGGMSGGSFSLANLSELCIGGEGLVAFKTFHVSKPDAKDKNTNPTVDYLTFNGNRLEPINPENDNTPPLSASENASKCTADDNCPSGDPTKANLFVCKTTAECLEGVKITAYMTDDSFEFYEEERFGEITKLDEAPYISWFADGGSLSLDRSRAADPPGPFKVTWSPPQKGGTFTLYVAAHDLRGGTSWRQYTISALTGETE